MLGQLDQNANTADALTIVPIAFHVDYFNKPWKDPFSDPRFSRREGQYSQIFNREHRLNNPNYLYLTPLLMIDGRVPMVGSNADTPAKVREAIQRARASKPRVSLDINLEAAPGDAMRKSLRIDVAPRSPRLTGRNVLVGVVTYEDATTTKIESGELAGESYVGRFVARELAVRPVRLSQVGPTTLRVPVEVKQGWNASRCGVVAFVQDEATGQIEQAARLRWSSDLEPAEPGLARPSR